MKHYLCLIVLLAFPSLILAGELEDRKKIGDSIAYLFLQEKFDTLSEISRKYLETEERTSSGLWKLSLFDAGIAKSINKKNKNEGYWNELENKALRWVKSQPNSPSGHIAYANILIQRAWMYRGEGWARDVKKESWKPYRNNLKKAKLYLTQHKNAAATDPRWYETMLTIALGEGWDRAEFDLLINEATTKFPYFYQIYFIAIDYLTPKWHGSKKEIEKFAQKVVETTKHIEKKGMYARVYWYASQTNYGADLFTKSDVTWSKMSVAIDDVLSQYPDQWNINNFAYFSCLAGDKNKTKRLINQVKGEPIIQAWKSKRFYHQCSLWSSQ